MKLRIIIVVLLVILGIVLFQSFRHYWFRQKPASPTTNITYDPQSFETYEIKPYNQLRIMWSMREGCSLNFICLGFF